MWLVFALSGAVTAAAVVTLSKAGLKNVHPSLAFAIQSVLILIVAWAAVAWEGNLHELMQVDKKAWIFLVAAGVLTACSSLLTFRALKLGDASVVSPVERVSMVFAILFAAVFLKEKLSWQLIGGAALMVAGAVIIALAKKT